MFYVQHQFEDVYWERDDEWDYTRAALEGSSFYKLPKILQWFTGNIGFHHIHHLSSRIPNYNLERCHNSHPIFTRVKPITFWSSLKTMSLRLWDEQHKKLVGFRRIHEIRKQQRQEKRGRGAEISGPWVYESDVEGSGWNCFGCCHAHLPLPHIPYSCLSPKAPHASHRSPAP